MKLTTKELLHRLGGGERVADLCAAAGMTRPQFDAWWRDECRRRVPTGQPLRSGVSIERDQRGIPTIRAANDADLFFGFGYATAQDRLFQLDFFRRKARGRIAEILGPEAVESDRLYRTLDLSRIADNEWTTLPADTQKLLQAYSDGINALINDTRDNVPIEFDLLDYPPARWQPTDSLAIIGDFRWYLTGRFPVIVIPELVKRALGDGALYREFLLGEADEESILQPGEYRRRQGDKEARRQGEDSGGGDGYGGSNNWVLAGTRTVTGRPLVASDPHIPFQAVSIWHEVKLVGETFHVAGVALVGMPAVMIGRNERVAWGITNNICSQRDLYQEKTDPGHPGCFLHDGRWEVAKQREEMIEVRGQPAVRHIVRSSRNGPIVDEFLPAPARETGPVSLRWLGFEPCGWLPALIGMNRARNCADLRESARPWSVPTFNAVFADVDGHIGFQTVGRIPLRRAPERGYRPGWDPQHQWTGFIPFDELPRLVDPPRGYAVTANNRVAPADYAYSVSGCWAGGYRARRIREEIEARAKWSKEDCQRVQMDVVSGRAKAGVPALIAALAGDRDPRVQGMLTLLKTWDHRIAIDSVAAAVFNVFFAHWCRRVMRERLDAAAADVAAANAGGLGVRLLAEDRVGWFRSDRVAAMREAFVAALDELATKLGPSQSQWTWGRLHTLRQEHMLTGRGDLGILLDRSGMPAPGDGTTVCSGTQDANHAAWLGATYRMVADLADSDLGMWSVEVSGESGHPGSPHYDDQATTWDRGELYYVKLQ